MYNYSLKNHNTFGIDVDCKRFVEFGSVDELRSLLPTLRGERLLVIGGGSNLLFTKDFDGTIVHSAIMGSEPRIDGDDVYLRVGSGETWDNIVAEATERGWHGMENLSLIPGEVGASAVQNIGAYGAEAKDIIYKVEAVEIATGEAVSFANADCHYAYRQSLFKTDWKGKYIVTHVTYKLTKTFTPHLDYGNIRAELERQNITQPTAQQLRQTIIDIRQAKLPDPKEEGNAGSFFMNPIVDRKKYDELATQYPEMPHYIVDDERVKIPAGWMIDQCGWKGKSLGKAGVHSKQALVLVNRGGATGNDVLALCRKIQADVLEKFGIAISPEVNVF